MALSPIDNTEQRYIEVSTTDSLGTSRTYDLSLGKILDGIDAIRQYIIKTLSTTRYRYLIYDDEYGSEIESLIIGDFSNDYVDLVLKRYIEEALLVDDRISSIDNVVVERTTDGKLFVTCTITSVFGTVTQEVNL